MPSSSRGSSLPRPSAFLVVALSGRAIALAARRAGVRVLAADLFGDTDLRAAASDSAVVPGDLERGFDGAALLAAAGRLAPPAAPARFGFVYGAGLENRVDLLEGLAAGRALYGNEPAAVARVKDPAQFFAVLDRLGAPHPEIAFAPPADAAHWLAKGAAGSGGAHVRPAEAAPAAAIAGGNGGDLYYQRRVAGRPIGISFLADGRSALIAGFNEQWTAPSRAEQPFRFGGAVQPAAICEALRRDAGGLLDALVAEFGLVGLNSLDVMDDGARYSVLEINPRPGANLDIYDRADPAGLFARHLDACEGRLPADWRPPSMATAMAVVYARRAARAPQDPRWPDWVVDRPAPGASIEAGAPVCTVLTEAPTAAAARRLAAERTARLLSMLAADGPRLPAVAAAGHA
jgi:predicted ATP-grasp superfamily ATP-dependent carboligase